MYDFCIILTILQPNSSHKSLADVVVGILCFIQRVLKHVLYFLRIMEKIKYEKRHEKCLHILPRAILYLLLHEHNFSFFFLWWGGGGGFLLALLEFENFVIFIDIECVIVVDRYSCRIYFENHCIKLYAPVSGVRR